ncbi:MAG TPA: hypothetical protein VFO18_02685 [Methylomirabilota bacterium]|nr:hypothetical protein [Methylomirabilota bacterium]
MRRFLKAVMLRAILAWAVLAVGDPVAAQSLTDSIQRARMTVIAIDYEAGRIVCLDSNGGAPLDDVDRAVARTTDLRLLQPGDVIKAEARDGKVRRITIPRHAWSELESPEG